ncbi:MAG: YtxH domain-containing protein [Chitinophagaceae bacterium]|nr:YtxH domain-containing protein [Chitinophagaceae bacterium]
MGLTTSAVNFINETSKDVGKDAVELKRQTDAATEEAKRNADAVAEETKRQADAIAEEAKRQADAAAAEAQRIAKAAAAKANRMTTQLQEEAKRKIGVIYDELQNKFARLHNEFDRTVRKAKDDIHVLLNEPHFAIIPPIKPDLDTWLMAIENRPVATAIIWETTAGIRLSYPFWNPTMKDDLSHAFDKAWNSDSVMPVEPFNNLVSGGGQVLSHDNAWTMFIAYVAQSIATETASHVRWSFAEYSSGELQQLFSSREMFKWLPRYSGYALQQTISGDVLPCAPHSVLEFLEENAIKRRPVA